MTRLLTTTALAAGLLFGVAACSDSSEQPAEQTTTESGQTPATPEGADENMAPSDSMSEGNEMAPSATEPQTQGGTTGSGN